jgi:hypothetical protein
MGADHAHIHDALRFIPADCDRQQWVRIGMALHDAVGDAGEDAWHDWSGTADSYDRNAAVAVWRSIARSNRKGVTAGTLYRLAIENGWQPPRKARRSAKPYVSRAQLLHTAHVLIVARSDVQRGRHAQWSESDCQSVRDALQLLVANPPRPVPIPARITHHKAPDPLLRLRNEIADAIEEVSHAIG